MTVFSIYLTDTDSNTVDGVIRFYDSNYVRVFEETSLAGSAINIDLPQGLYWVRVYSISHTFLPKMILLEDNAIFRMIGTSNLINVPNDPNVCRIFGKLVDVIGKPLKGWKISIFAPDGMYNRNNDLSSPIGSVVSDEYGNVEFDLLRNQEYIINNVPIVMYNDTTYDVVSRPVFIPDQSVSSLIDIVIPRPILVTAPTNYNSGTIYINPTVFLSNGAVLKEVYEVSEILVYIGNVSATYNKDLYSFVFTDIPIGTHRVMFKTAEYKAIGATNNEAQPIKRVGPKRDINYIDINVS